jgi:hypothetical protein
MAETDNAPAPPGPLRDGVLAFESAGTAVAFPSQTVYLRRDGFPDPGKEGQAL